MGTTATTKTTAVTVGLNIVVVVVVFFTSTIIVDFDTNCSGMERFACVISGLPGLLAVWSQVINRHILCASLWIFFFF